MQSSPYSRTAILLHWLVALLILAAFTIGLTATNLGMSPTRLRLINWHKWVGICILALTLVRLLWRSRHSPPAAHTAPRWQMHAAALAHAGLYLLCLAMPLLGWTYSSASGFPVVVFGVIPLPNLVAPDRDIAEVLKTAHRFTGYVLGSLVLLHVAAALKHHFVSKDGLLSRMNPQHVWRKSV
ncbi:MAG: cytochrome b [Pseudomonadota bacterium]